MFGASVLGLYSRASLIVSLPAEYALTSIFKVIYPIYGRVREDVARTRILVDDALTLTTGLLWPLIGLVAGASPVIVAVLLGARWDDAAPLLTLFALIAGGWVPCGLLTNVAEALGWMKIIAVRHVIFGGSVAVAMLATYLADLGLHWLLAGIAVCDWGVYILMLQPFIHRNLLETRTVLRRQLVNGAVALAAFWGRSNVRPGSRRRCIAGASGCSDCGRSSRRGGDPRRRALDSRYPGACEQDRSGTWSRHPACWLGVTAVSSPVCERTQRWQK